MRSLRGADVAATLATVARGLDDVSVQLPATSGESDGLAELFLFAGPWFPGV